MVDMTDMVQEGSQEQKVDQVVVQQTQVSSSQEKQGGHNETLIEQIQRELLTFGDHLQDMSPLDDDNIVIALFQSYAWNVLTFGVAAYWYLICRFFGVLSLLNHWLSKTDALIYIHFMSPVLFSIELNYRKPHDQLAHYRLLSLIHFAICSILQHSILHDYQLNFQPPPVCFIPIVYVVVLPLLCKWFGYDRRIVLSGSVGVLFVVYLMFGIMFRLTPGFYVMAIALCFLSLLIFQMKMSSLRINDELSVLDEGSRINLYLIAYEILTVTFGTQINHQSTNVSS